MNRGHLAHGIASPVLAVQVRVRVIVRLMSSGHHQMHPDML